MTEPVLTCPECGSDRVTTAHIQTFMVNTGEHFCHSSSISHIRGGSTMTEPTDNLQQRCAEVVEWQRTGVLPGNALRDYAAAHWAGRHDSLQMAERDTSAQAMQWVAKWGTNLAVAGEPYGYVYTVQVAPIVGDERKVERTVFTRNKPPCDALALYTAPQPTQAQAGAVPLTDEQIEAARIEVFKVHGADLIPAVATTLARAIEAAHGIGIKGGQHGESV